MPDSKYCYPDSEVLKNKLNITDRDELFEAEKELTAIRLKELQDKPVKGKFILYNILHSKLCRIGF